MANMCLKKYYCFLCHAIIFLLVLFSSAGSVWADCAVKFNWLPNPENYVAGYKIYYGIVQGGPYVSAVDVGIPALINDHYEATVSGLIEGTTYYFVATAYDANGFESEYCSEVVYTCSVDGPLPPPVDLTPPSPPAGLGVTK
ncbi:MAG: fibronectin type III domain-containing protein [Deltaproteobacteria bacterium]|nr:fibronectin type III domain-containing protein [Candidatus Anaeroferrophillus wilburensis]MBN2889270.1 fibronectin type III domain-containing protein [Deltaproteobacteria bacterium]